VGVQVKLRDLSLRTCVIPERFSGDDSRRGATSNVRTDNGRAIQRQPLSRHPASMGYNAKFGWAGDVGNLQSRRLTMSIWSL